MEEKKYSRGEVMQVMQRIEVEKAIKKNTILEILWYCAIE